MRFVLLSIFSVILLSSCIKRYGCTQGDSVNYDPKAQLDDGSCVWDSHGWFWWEITDGNNLVADGVTELKFYMDGEFLYTADPLDNGIYSECDSAAYPFAIKIYAERNARKELRVLDQDDSIRCVQELYISPENPYYEDCEEIRVIF